MKTVKRNTDNMLLRIRKEMGLTQEKMAGELGMGYTAYKMAEQGRRPVSTDALVKVARLEIMLRNKIPLPLADKPHPVEIIFTSIYRRDFQSLFMKESVYRKQVPCLELKLERMHNMYTKTREWLNMLELFLKQRENDDTDMMSLKRQQMIIIKKLEHCSLPAQRLLKAKIEILEAEAILYRSAHEKLKKELPEFFGNNEA